MLGYALMRRAADIEAVWQASPLMARHRVALEDIRRAVGLTSVARYRGIGRFPLAEFDQLARAWHTELISTERDERDDPEFEAQIWLQVLLGPDHHDTAWPRAVLGSLDDLLEVRDGLVAPDEYEIVELGLEPDHPARLLGFDVGCWGGGNFSILCDAAIWPTWHPPDTAALQRLAAFVAQLNEHLLFPTAEVAREYLAWYVTQDWAEKEPEDFRVIALGAVEARMKAD